MQPAPRHAVAATTHANPFPYYAQLRRERPFGFDEELGVWVAASAAAVEEALAHPHLRVRPPAEPVPRALVGTAVGDVFAHLVRMNDGAFHREHRPAVTRATDAFSRLRVEAAAIEAAGDLVERTGCDAWLSSVPVQAMARLLGVPEAQLDATVAHVQAFTQGIAAAAPAEAIALADEAARILMAQGEAQGLTPVGAANRIALMQQSLDATAGLIGNAILTLQREPRVPDAGFVEQEARWNAPTHHTRRFAAQPTTLAGHTLKEGDGIVVLLACANHDPGASRSFGFGWGPHACPGERIATGIAAGALRFLHDSGQLARFGAPTGYRPLPNVRIPTFA